MKSEVYSISNSEIIEMLGGRFKEYRKRMGISQKELADQTGLSIFTISTFETGKASGITLASFIKMLRAIEELEQILALLPELPQSPKELFEQQLKSRRK